MNYLSAILRSLVAGAALVCLSACQTIDYEASYDSETDFSTYESYQWKTDEMGRPILPDFRRTDLQSVVDAELAARGFQKAERDADLTVLVLTAGEVNTFGAGPGSVPPGYTSADTTLDDGFDADVFTDDTYTRGHLIIDLIDTESGELVWRGYATGLTDNEDRIIRELPVIVRRLFDELPVE